jgi:hypothetical protein
MDYHTKNHEEVTKSQEVFHENFLPLKHKCKASGLAWDGTYLYSGLYSAPVDGSFEMVAGNTCPAGIYLYRISTGKAHSTGVMVRSVGH